MYILILIDVTSTCIKLADGGIVNADYGENWNCSKNKCSSSCPSTVLVCSSLLMSFHKFFTHN